MFPSGPSDLLVSTWRGETADFYLPVKREMLEVPTHNVKFCYWLRHICALTLGDGIRQARLSWAALSWTWKGPHPRRDASNCLCHQVMRKVIK